MVGQLPQDLTDHRLSWSASGATVSPTTTDKILVEARRAGCIRRSSTVVGDIRGTPTFRGVNGGRVDGRQVDPAGDGGGALTRSQGVT